MAAEIPPAKAKALPMRVCLLLCLLAGATWAQPRHFVTRAQWGSKPQAMGDALRHTPGRIVLHHSGTLWKPDFDSRKKIVEMQSWGQREKNWPDLPYHFMIDPQGTVFEGREMYFRPESNTKYDLAGVINVELWGNFEEQKVSREQLLATVETLAWLRDSYQLTRLSAHRLEAPGQTVCPGRDFMRYFESGQLQKWVDACRDGAFPAVETLP